MSKHSLIPCRQLDYPEAIQLGHEDPGVFHGYEICKNNLCLLGCFLTSMGVQLEKSVHCRTFPRHLETLFPYTLGDITSSFRPWVHLRSSGLNYFYFYFFFEEEIRTQELMLVRSNTPSDISDLTEITRSLWEGFAEFIWISAAKRCLGRILYDGWGKKTPSHLFKIYIFLFYNLLL